MSKQSHITIRKSEMNIYGTIVGTRSPKKAPGYHLGSNEGLSLTVNSYFEFLKITNR
jgi:hypothetical protein